MRLGIALALAFTIAFAQSGPPTKGTYNRIKVHGKSLEGNLSGEPADRDVSVYLPPSYQQDTARRYPVVYLLHGYTNSDLGWFGPESRGSFANGNTMTAAADRAYSGTGTPEVILVMPNAYTIYQGSMFSNSVTTGDWEGFIAKIWSSTSTAITAPFLIEPAGAWLGTPWAATERCASPRNIRKYFRASTS